MAVLRFCAARRAHDGLARDVLLDRSPAATLKAGRWAKSAPRVAGHTNAVGIGAHARVSPCHVKHCCRRYPPLAAR